MKDVLVIAGLTEALEKEKRSYIKKMITYFLIGKTINENTESTYMNAMQYANLFGMSPQSLHVYRKVANHFNNDVVKFKEYLDAHPDIKSFTRLYTHLYGIDRKTNAILADLKNVLNKLYHYYEEASYEERCDIIKRVNKYISEMRLKMPDGLYIKDTNYFKYNECVFCGAYPPPEEGYELKFIDEFGFERMPLPICKECVENGNDEPDWKLVAKMFCAYAVELDDAFENIYR